MDEQSRLNKVASNYRTYRFCNKRDGVAEVRDYLKKDMENYNDLKGKKIAVICGFNDRKTIPLSLMGADVTIYKISEENKRYALKLAKYSNRAIEYIVQDIYNINISKYKEYFDILYLEGGIIHYINDINKFMTILYSLLKNGGRIVLSDFHPIKNCISENLSIKGDLLYNQPFYEDEQENNQDDYKRLHTLGEIINSVLDVGFKLERFDEHPKWTNDKIPGEFTILATKQ